MTVLVEVWQSLGKLDDLAVGEMREVALPSGKLVLLIRSESGLRACCADCPHQATPLAEGMLDGNVLTCPLHFWQWNIETGEEMGVAEAPLEIFELRQENGKWLIRA
ncbi:Rieske 2Fe-2S domain-containing protein [Bradyrhizobium sp. URHD0069]|jgi:nitrite reductase/ring-hydroxylating ferredoxin subunit|uniref:Rieske 2Fe-2S domain-containing protein n=1 Tax=Bradyrhizobium sp. URHD0069 TaxID=1380355 RepID=UPI000495A2F5|nr:Rieske 2Fe-2S domain-containing protein [Bradyrhizobium sp. URHD0069]